MIKYLNIKYWVLKYKIFKAVKKLKYLNKCQNCDAYMQISKLLASHNDDYLIQMLYHVDDNIVIYITAKNINFVNKQVKCIYYENGEFKANFETELVNELNNLKIKFNKIPKLRLLNCFGLGEDIRFLFCTFQSIQQSLLTEIHDLNHELKILCI